ncbi:hypothetical protein B0G71_8255 [Paraburkholderia sp. BL27I4N3]|uniref:hypothetical protein n=1 Tax=Paraburkholderia sp. BL27I4N3 TaxID=1938805 RepID=UPI000E266C53|nr:hypothetical protein [Paraburkholderia sp. BL27I4N3]REE06575.1 hypothetical protein B0G71_8255 [Paraburkholderia sp. BL27I4N3]
MVKSVKPPVNARRVPALKKSGNLMSKVDPTHIVQVVDSASGMFKGIAEYGAERQRTEQARIEAGTRSLEIKAEVMKHAMDFEVSRLERDNERSRDEHEHARELCKIDNKHDLATKQDDMDSRHLDMFERGEISAEVYLALVRSRNAASQTDTDD